MQNQPTEQFPLSQRLSLLREIMERRDISATAKNICWLLLCERMNSHTGMCACSNSHIAKKLGIDLATVKRAKLELLGRPPRRGAATAAPVLEMVTPAQNAPTKLSQISSYRFLSRFGAQNAPTKLTNCAERKMRPAQNAPTSNRKISNKTDRANAIDKWLTQSTQKVKVTDDSPQHDAWCIFWRARGLPVQRSARWGFTMQDTEWPPGH